MKRPLPIEVSDLAKAQIRAAEEWWCRHRPAAPRAIREELERASWLMAVQPGVGALARNVLPRVHVGGCLLQVRVPQHLLYVVQGLPRLHEPGCGLMTEGLPPDRGAGA